MRGSCTAMQMLTDRLGGGQQTCATYKQVENFTFVQNAFDVICSIYKHNCARTCTALSLRGANRHGSVLHRRSRCHITPLVHSVSRSCLTRYASQHVTFAVLPVENVNSPGVIAQDAAYHASEFSQHCLVGFQDCVRLRVLRKKHTCCVRPTGFPVLILKPASCDKSRHDSALCCG